MSIVLTRLIADAVLVAVCLFGAAGTADWWRGWTLVATLLTIRVLGAVVVYSKNPALLRDRAKLPLHADQAQSDKLLVVCILATGFLGVPMLAAADVFHLHALPQPPSIVADAGIALFTLGWVLKSLVLLSNPFATSAVRLQSERSHAVCSAGPYRFVRHPFYAADPLIFLGLSLWLESYLAALCAVVPLALIVVRLQLEERFLQHRLPGYSEYSTRVRYRLLPGVW